ncbi:septum site-determining protein MinD [Candidatus Synchoanobacter obligatus]|uniref:Septum site-determining protein MinD n=1 Tax=Candidatus Synchoanobacter obligatus TaxID=2919597 RepID=A0ABT1L790_9GAMM|nr:septum site-determining protein MinD [Candidatus Synchoanobacter obligatus]MCP8352636.1 septum site-determining protein MinD [Candidatus Synchoanobacter obligatus]
MSKVIVITSGKGGVGKTTSAAAISAGLALKGKNTCVIDFDVGLRNLDLVMGCERRVIYDIINVIQGDANLNQALIKDKRTDKLYILPASQTRDKDALTLEGVQKIIEALKERFDFIICDSPAGIEKGAQLAMHFADEAIIVTNPEISSIRDSDRMLGMIASKTDKAINNQSITEHLLITRYDADRVEKGEMMKYTDIGEILSVKILGIIPESPAVLDASNTGSPVIFNTTSDAGTAYADAVARLLGSDISLKFCQPKKSFIQRLNPFQKKEAATT